MRRMKAILVFDINDLTYKGLKESFVNELTLHLKHNGFYQIKDVELKPVPQKLEVDVKRIEDIMHTEFQMVDVIQDKIKAEIKFNTDKLIALGYNHCIDEITGE